MLPAGARKQIGSDAQPRVKVLIENVRFFSCMYQQPRHGPGSSEKGAFMILRQFLHANPVGIFGCGGRASAAVVDPVGDITPYLQVAKEPLYARRLGAFPSNAQ